MHASRLTTVFTDAPAVDGMPTCPTYYEIYTKGSKEKRRLIFGGSFRLTGKELTPRITPWSRISERQKN
jgi:hypothetical protein